MQVLLGTFTLDAIIAAPGNLRAAFQPLVIIYMNFNDQNVTSVDVC